MIFLELYMEPIEQQFQILPLTLKANYHVGIAFSAEFIDIWQITCIVHNHLQHAGELSFTIKVYISSYMRENRALWFNL